MVSEVVLAAPSDETRLSGGGLALARAGWFAIALVTTASFAFSLPLRYAHYRAVCPATRCLVDELTPERVGALHTLGLSPDVYAATFVGLALLIFAVFVAVALVLYWRRSDDWLVLLASGTLMAFGGITFPVTVNFIVPVYPSWRLALDALPFTGAILPIVFFALFPDGRLLPRWTTLLIVLYVAEQVLHFFFVGLPGSARLFQSTQFPVYFIVYGGVVVAQTVRYRWWSSPRQRLQTKWVIVGITTALAGYLAAVVPFAIDPAVGTLPFSGLIATAVAYVAQLFLPLSIGFAILRWRLWDIDLIINRALVYGPVTLTLAAIYFSSVIVLETVFRVVVGATSEPAIVLSTLTIAALFVPIRRRIQSFIDRRFYRRAYDTAQIIAAFGASIRDVVELADLSSRLADVVDKTMEPSLVSLWVRDTASGRSLPIDLLASLTIGPHDPLIAYCVATPGAILVDRVSLPSPALESLRSSGVKLLLPLIGEGSLLGLLNLGPRRSGLDYATDDRRLLNAVATQAAPAFRIAELVSRARVEAQQRERVEQELRLAQQIQQSLLPQEVPFLPGWEVCSRYQPAREVGGDFYDFLVHDGGRLAVVIGDATDKGMPAALLMAATRGILRAVANRADSPGATLGEVNDLLRADAPPNMFVTCLYAIIDPISGHVHYANAGHVPLYHRHSDGVRELASGELPLGVVSGVSYENHEVDLAPGDEILFSSDGLVEALNPSHESYGFPRLVGLLRRVPSGANLIEHVVTDLAAFTGAGAEPEDDLTLVTIRRTEPAPP